MADVWYKSGQFITPASGTTVINTTDKGTNPKLIHVWFSRVTADDTIQAHQHWGHGMSDGVDHDTMIVTAQDGANLNERDGRSANLFLISDPASVATDNVLATTVAMNANDVTISYATFTAGYRIHYEIWGGTGTTANMIQYGSAVANSPLTHGLGTKPDLVMVCTNGQAHPASSIHSYLSFGIANDNGSSIDQWNLHSFFGDSDIDFVGSALTVGDIAGQYDSDFADWDSTITAISTTTVTWTETAAPGGDINIMAVLNFQGDGAVGVKVGTFTKSTGTAPSTTTMPDFGFTPSGYHVASANLNSTAKPATNTDRISHVSHGAYDGTTQHSALTVGTPASNADRASQSRTDEVLQGSPALQATGIDWSGTAQAITDATPDIIFDPNTAVAEVIGFYGIEEQAAGPDETATGAPSIGSITSAGTATVERFATGSPTISAITASGNAEVSNIATGAPEITNVEAAGSSEVIKTSSGTVTIASIIAAGTAEILNTAVGTPSLTVITAAGVSRVDRFATGSPTLTAITSTGVAEVINTASGAVTITAITASGTAEILNTATGSPEITAITSAGTADVDVAAHTATGAPSITVIEASGTAEVLNTAVGSPSITAITSAGSAGLDRNATGSPSITAITSAGTAEDIHPATGSPSITAVTSAGTTALVAFEQEGYRWRNDDGTEATATWRNDQDVIGIVDKEIRVRLRVLSNATGDTPTGQATLQCKDKRDPDSEYRTIS